ncbi:type I DNA topoisomerase [Thermaurantiacus sp.]
MDLVIVESPAKAKTIASYLGPGYEVVASYGHVRDLVEKEGSVDPDRDFAMRWEVADERSRKQVKAIAEAAKGARRLLLATDPDREGEAISWHLAELLTARKAVPAGGLARVTFNAVTRDAVRAAIAAPRPIDQALVDSYLARRALDYLVGFTLSPVLWRKLPGARSAGRVQSVALRLIVEREREIEAFVPRTYWTVEALLETADGASFRARLAHLDGRRLGRFDLADAEAAEAARARVEAAAFRVAAVEKRPLKRNPAPPFTTSTLQQEASRKLGLGAQETMRLAQALYEAGRITYMRTDGVAMAPEGLEGARAAIRDAFPSAFLPATARRYSAKARNAQEAHEAIRPTDFSLHPDQSQLGGAEQALYALIWKRAVASQMASAELERTTVELRSDDESLGLRASGTVVRFPGFLALYGEDVDDPAEEEEGRLPEVRAGDRPRLLEVAKAEHVTEPPPRYSEASLVKRLEELGIGRPSTYAAIIEVLKKRAYVRLEKKRFLPEEKGRLVTAFLERFFERYVSYDFTAGLENELDLVSAGEAAYRDVLAAFWRDFKARTDEVMARRPSEVTQALDQFLEPWLFPPRADGTDPRLCPACGTGRLSLKVGRNGPFVGCSAYPECRFTRGFSTDAEAAGPRLLGVDPGTGEPVMLKAGRFGAYLELGGTGKRVSLPKDVDPEDFGTVLRLLSLPREIGRHPETGKPIVANLGRYGPYLSHDGKSAKLKSTADLFETGMNRAVALLSAPKGAGRRGPEPLRSLGPHPETGAEVRLMPGRFGPYVTDGTTKASLPKDATPEAVTLEVAVELLAARAASAAGTGGSRRRPAGAEKPARKAHPRRKTSASATRRARPRS